MAVCALGETKGGLPFVRTGRPERTGSHRRKWKGQGGSARLLTRSLRGIHARADVNNMPHLATKLSNIPPTFLRDFLSPKEEDILFLNDLEEEFVFFFSYLYFFSEQINENCGLLRIHDHGSSLSMRRLQKAFPDNIHDIRTTY